MSKIYICGDVHGYGDIHKIQYNFEEGKSLSKNDYLIVLGDFGLLWNNDEMENDLIEYYNSRPWTNL